MSFIKSTGELGEGGVLDGDVVVIPEIICQASSTNLGSYLNMAALFPELGEEAEEVREVFGLLGWSWKEDR